MNIEIGKRELLMKYNVDIDSSLPLEKISIHEEDGVLTVDGQWNKFKLPEDKERTAIRISEKGAKITYGNLITTPPNTVKVIHFDFTG